MLIRCRAVVCAVRHHGEHGAIVRLMTPEHGLVAGYVRGGRGTRLRPVLVPGNVVAAELQARVANQLPSLTVELINSRGPLMNEPLPAAAISWLGTLTTATLPEEQAYPAVYDALTAMLDAIAMAPSARGWAEALIRFELLLLAELGFGLDLSSCAATGSAHDLAFVSPRTGHAVSRDAAVGHEARLLALPAFLISPAQPDWRGIFEGLSLTAVFLERAFFQDRRASMLDARTRLIDQLKRAVA